MSGYTEIALLQHELEKLRAELAEKDAEVEKLKRLNSSYSSLTKAQEGQLTALRNRLYELRGADKTLDSEREANAILTEQLAAEQLNNKLLRGALQAMVNSAADINCGLKIADDALSIPASTEELDAYVEQKIKEYY